MINFFPFLWLLVALVAVQFILCIIIIFRYQEASDNEKIMYDEICRVNRTLEEINVTIRSCDRQIQFFRDEQDQTAQDISAVRELSAAGNIVSKSNENISEDISDSIHDIKNIVQKYADGKEEHSAWHYHLKFLTKKKSEKK